MRTKHPPILEYILEPIASALNPKAARTLLNIRADSYSQARVAELAEKCNQGTLTEDERDQYEMYIQAGRVVALFRAKAKAILAKKKIKSRA